MVCSRYGVLPSDLVRRDLTDFCLDLFIAREAVRWENKAADKAHKQAQQRSRRRR